MLYLKNMVLFFPLGDKKEFCFQVTKKRIKLEEITWTKASCNVNNVFTVVATQTQHANRDWKKITDDNFIYILVWTVLTTCARWVMHSTEKPRTCELSSPWAGKVGVEAKTAQQGHENLMCLQVMKTEWIHLSGHGAWSLPSSSPLSTARNFRWDSVWRLSSLKEQRKVRRMPGIAGRSNDPLPWRSNRRRSQVDVRWGSGRMGKRTEERHCLLHLWPDHCSYLVLLQHWVLICRVETA